MQLKYYKTTIQKKVDLDYKITNHKTYKHYILCYIIGIYKGNTNISKIYRGDMEIKKIYLGDTQLYANQVVAPTITYVSKGDTSLTFTITNNDSEQAVIYYEHTDSTPDASSVTLAAGATSTNLTISGLAELTSYTIYAQATKTGADSSTVVSFTETTSGWTQLGSEYSKASGSPLIGTYLSSTWFMPTFNNSSVAARYWRFMATSQSGAVSNEYWTRLQVKAYNGTNYTNSSIVSYGGYITSYINAPGNAFANDSNTAASVDNGNHVGSAIYLDFGTNVYLNQIWIRTGYTKISGMTLYYK